MGVPSGPGAGIVSAAWAARDGPVIPNLERNPNPAVMRRLKEIAQPLFPTRLELAQIVTAIRQPQPRLENFLNAPVVQVVP